jgi:hypothetical protein
MDMKLAGNILLDPSYCDSSFNFIFNSNSSPPEAGYNLRNDLGQVLKNSRRIGKRRRKTNENAWNSIPRLPWRTDEAPAGIPFWAPLVLGSTRL